MGFVYRWTNKTNGKWYIGSHNGTIDDGYVGSGIMFKTAYLKYGSDNFVREILYEGDLFRDEEERILIELDAAGSDLSYNMKNQAFGVIQEGPANGMYGRRQTDEVRAAIGKGVLENRWGTVEQRVEHSQLMSGAGNPMFGVSRKGTWAVEKGIITKSAKRQGWEFLGNEKHHVIPFRDIFRRLVKTGRLVSPRGQLVIEAENFSYVLPPFVRFCNFQHRKLNVNYIRKEILWYLRGDSTDLSIMQHAKMWKDLVNIDGTINSNYGQYIFGTQNQFDNVVKTLSEDRDSRRASIVILSERHLKMETKDVPCTYSLNFRIRNNTLNMSVHMRSQDAIFGMGNDAAVFSVVHEMVLNALWRVYPDLRYGDYFHIADSFHAYERHFEMLSKLTGYEKGTDTDGFTKREKARLSSYKFVMCPMISGPDEVDFLRLLDFTSIPETYKFSKWLVTTDTVE